MHPCALTPPTANPLKEACLQAHPLQPPAPTSCLTIGTGIPQPQRTRRRAHPCQGRAPLRPCCRPGRRGGPSRQSRQTGRQGRQPGRHPQLRQQAVEAAQQGVSACRRRRGIGRALGCVGSQEMQQNTRRAQRQRRRERAHAAPGMLPRGLAAARTQAGPSSSKCLPATQRPSGDAAARLQAVGKGPSVAVRNSPELLSAAGGAAAAPSERAAAAAAARTAARVPSLCPGRGGAAGCCCCTRAPSGCWLARKKLTWRMVS